LKNLEKLVLLRYKAIEPWLNSIIDKMQKKHLEIFLENFKFKIKC